MIRYILCKMGIHKREVVGYLYKYSEVQKCKFCDFVHVGANPVINYHAYKTNWPDFVEKYPAFVGRYFFKG